MNILEGKDISVSESSLNYNFELVSTGREIGEESNTAVSKDTVISRNIYKGVDIEYQILKGRGLKEEIVLRELPEYSVDCSTGACSLPVNRFLFKLQLDEGLKIQRSIDGNIQYPSGTLYITDTEGNYFAHFLPEFAVDAVGNKTSKVYSNISQADSGEYEFEIVLDPEWLLSSDRVFPIRIDPSIVHSSDELSALGIYDRVGMNESMSLALNSDKHISGTYTSSILDLGKNSTLNSISWSGYSQATGDGETPYSEMGLIYQNGFNDLISQKRKWGSSALQLDSLTSELNIQINSLHSNFFTLELWSNMRNVDSSQDIFRSNLIKLGVKDGKYVLYDSQNIEYITNISVNFNTWEYIALVMDISNMTVNLYVNELEESINTPFSSSSFQFLTFSPSYGYIDEVRIYDRLVPRNELLGNSQLSNIYLEYSFSDDGEIFTDWHTELNESPVLKKEEGNVSFSSDLNMYQILSFEHLLSKEENITIGRSRFVNGLDDESMNILEGDEGEISAEGDIKYVDVLFTPNTMQNSCILALGGLQIYSKESGEIQVELGESSNILTKDQSILNSKNVLSVSLSDTQVDIYLNGNILSSSNTYILNPTSFSKGKGCTLESRPFDGEIESVRISSENIEEKDIYEYGDILERTLLLTPAFSAKLQKDGEILNLNSKTFSIYEGDSFTQISNLFVGDTLVISQDEYMAQGKVESVDINTGVVNISEWEEGFSFPPAGFTKSANISKWQREYIYVKRFVDGNTSLNITTPIWIRNVELFNAKSFKNDILFENIKSRYMKYRFIYMTSHLGLSSYISSVNVEYESGGPQMDQVLRHGQWFNEGVKQGFWWVNSN